MTNFRGLTTVSGSIMLTFWKPKAQKQSFKHNLRAVFKSFCNYMYVQN